MMTSHAFQPEAVETLAAAFQKAWRSCRMIGISLP
jgi:hypothetical protein